MAGSNYSKYLQRAGVTSQISIGRQGRERQNLTWILFEPKLRNLRLSSEARAAIGMDSRKLFDSSSSTRLETPEDNIKVDLSLDILVLPPARLF